MKNNPNEKTKNRKKLLYSVLAIIAAAALLAGLSYAWFFNRTDMATLMEIREPSNISILGPGGSEMTSLDLNYTDTDKNGDQVTVRRVICVQSAVGDDYKLEIVHTTNLKDLTFTLYPVSKTGSEKVTETVDNKEYTYNYSKSSIEGSYINLSTPVPASGYRIADNSQHQKNYDSYDKVQAHAEPLYWLANNTLQPCTDNQVTIEGKNYNRTYYVCEVTWTEKEKETDIFYILAKSVTATAQN